MDAHSTSLWLSGALYFIYGGICIIALIFTFSIDTYYKIDGVFNLELYLNRFLNPLLDRKMGQFEAWLVKHNRVVGPILTVLAILDLKLSFNIINTLYFYLVIT